MANPYTRTLLGLRFPFRTGPTIPIRHASAISERLPVRRFASSSFRTTQQSQRRAVGYIWVRLGTALASASLAAAAGDALLSSSTRTIWLDDSVSRIAESHADEIAREDESYQPYRPLRNFSLSKLLNSYVVFTLCSFPWIVNAGPALMDWCATTQLPLVWPLTEWFARHTFFKCFVSDDTAVGSIPVLSELSRNGLGSLLNYSVEVSKDSAQGSSSALPSQAAIHRPFVDELIHSVDVAAEFTALPSTFGAANEEEAKQLAARPDRSGSTFVAIKLSGLLYDSSVLERASAAIVPREWFSSPPEPAPPAAINASGPCGALAIPIAALKPKDVEALKELWQALREVALRAQKHGNVRIVVDAEYSWYQPAIDAMYEAIAAEFNRPMGRPNDAAEAAHRVTGPLIFNTFQAYLRRTPSHLAASLERARLNGYTLGVKLVRGAYMDIENATWSNKSVGTPPVPVATRSKAAPPEYEGWKSPVWPTKDLTDRCFDGCAVRLVEEIQRDIEKGKRTGAQPRLAVMFATHNSQSALRVARKMLELGMVQPDESLAAAANASGEPVPLVNMRLQDSIRGRIFFGQLYGMASVLTARLQAAFDPDSGGPGPHMVLKYVPYGPLKLVMPYLVRRAVENASIMGGGASREKELVRNEILYRLDLKH
ncbi:proline dehydrogenase [Thecaphora frezii]